MFQKRRTGKWIVFLLIAVLCMGNVLPGTRVSADDAISAEFEDAEDRNTNIENGNRAGSSDNTENGGNETEERLPLYDAEALSKTLEELGVGLNESGTESMGRMARVAPGQRVNTYQLRPLSRIDMVYYNWNHTSWTFGPSWTEGLLCADGEWAYCADPNAHFSAGTKTVYHASQFYNEATIRTIGGLFWYFDTYQNADGHIPSDYVYLIKQCAVWLVLNQANGWLPGVTLECGNNVMCPKGDKYISGHLAETLDWGMNTVREEWDNLEASGVLIKGNGQDLSQWSYSYNPKGYAKLKKVSANPSITDGNGCYSLAGAKYGIWKNKECTEGTGVSFTTDADGNSNTVTLNRGTYYVKEITAPKGFALDQTVYSVTVSSGQTATLTIKDHPTMDPVRVLLEKVDKETNQKKPQGSAALEGALFEVKFYDVLSDTDPAEAGEEAERSWIFRTNQEGVCEYDTSFLESGDELYFTRSGVPGIPLGTITIRENTPPEGYLLNPEVYVMQITGKNDGSEFVYSYSEPTIPENTLDLNIVKIEKNTVQAIPGAVFCHMLPDGSTEEVTTDEEGKAAFKGLTWGEHTVREVSVPEGYTINPGKVTFTVEKGNEITVTSNTATDTEGSMTFTVSEDGSALLEVEDTLAPYELLLYKQNQHDKALKGAEFTLYSDKKCIQTVAKGTTNEDGTVSFAKLAVGMTYYLKETKAPQGYRIPVHADGSEIVYEIRTESNPLTDQFVYYVDGKKHTSQTGKFAVTGTKAERIVNLTVVNNTGVKLPETGTPAEMILFLLGTACMAGAVGYYLKKGKSKEKKNEKKKNRKK